MDLKGGDDRVKWKPRSSPRLKEHNFERRNFLNKGGEIMFQAKFNKIIIFIFILIISIFSFTNSVYAKASEPYKSNAIFLEVVGQSVGFFSLNTDYRFHPNFTFRAGFGISLGFTVPVSINFITGKESSHHLEIGTGVTYAKGLGKAEGLVPTAVFGYRYQPREGGLMFRLSFTPCLAINKSTGIDRSGYVETYYNVEFFPLAGISIGYCFKKNK